MKKKEYKKITSNISQDLDSNLLNYEAWVDFISYYRYYIDEFACDI